MTLHWLEGEHPHRELDDLAGPFGSPGPEMWHPARGPGGPLQHPDLVDRV